MRSITAILSVFVLLLVCFSASGAAVENTNPVLNFEVISSEIVPFALPIYGEVSIGETDYHVYSVPTSATLIEVALIWNEDNNSEIMLTVYLPTGTTMSFYDADDGMNDNAITLNFSVPGNCLINNLTAGVRSTFCFLNPLTIENKQRQTESQIDN